MKVIRARTAGFCMGVGLALRKLRQTVRESAGSRTGRIVMWGPIIHNPQVLAGFREQGVCLFTRAEDILPGDRVLIRAHGIPLSEEKALRLRGAEILDATCPKVKKAQLLIAGATRNREPLLLFGEADHPEVRGLVSYAGGACRVFAAPEELEQEHGLEAWFGKGDIDDAEVVLAAQTTQEITGFSAAEVVLRRYTSRLRVLSTICEATSSRQKEVMDIARQVDMMIVAGGKESGNTRRLADVARNMGVAVLHVETPEELAASEALRGCGVVGLTAGASTPPALVDAMQCFLERFD